MKHLWKGLGGLSLLAGIGLVLFLTMTPETQVPTLSYTVVRGDTLFEIARDHGVSLEDLRAWNDLEGDLIEVNQVLVIRSSEPRGPASPAPRLRPKPREEVPTTPRLTRPAPKRCLSGPSSSLEGDRAMAASVGLDPAAIRDTMSGFIHHVLPCVSSMNPGPSGPLDLQIRVGCDGLVSEVKVLSKGDWSDEAASCVQQTLSYAEFPAHALPDGEVFRYPLQFTPG